MNKKVAIGLVAAGAALNIADAYTAKGTATGGVVYGATGFLKPVNDMLPLNLGVMLMVAGAALFAYLKFGR